MRSTLCYLRTRPLVEDPESGEKRPATDHQLLNMMNCSVVGSDSEGEYMLVAPGCCPPDEAEVLIDGRDGYWEWSDLRDQYPEAADRILQAAVVRENEEGNQIREYVKMADADDPVEIDLPPRGRFAGDEESLVANKEVRDDDPPYRREDFEDQDAPVLLLAEHKVEEWNEWRRRNLGIKPDLRGFNFVAASLTGADLRNLDLRGAVLTRANLEGARLDDADLRDAYLIKANLTEAQLLGADLSGCEGRKAILNGAQLSRAVLESAKLNGAKFRNVKGGRPNLDRPPSFAHSSLRGAEFHDANLPYANFQGAVLLHADFTGAQLYRDNFSNAVMVEANLRDARVRAVDFSGANLSEANICGADLRRANFSNADVSQIEYAEYGGSSRYRGIRVATCYGDAIFRRDAQDADFLESLREKTPGFLMELWRVTCDYGRAPLRFFLWLFGIIVVWACLYGVVLGPHHFAMPVEKLSWSWLTPLYYSVVTFSTLGLGDITPVTETAMVLVIAEVILGYIMLGILITLVATKIARRA